MNRAYSVLQVKAVDDGARVIRGIATTPTPDRAGDIVDPLGVQFKNPMPLLWQHQSDKPIGTVNFEKPTASGIAFEASLPVIAEAGTLKDRVDEAWQSIKLGLVSAVSIGFRALEYSFMENGGVRFSESEVLELSAVTIPANAEAVISTIKSIDAIARKEAGIAEPEIPQNPAQAATGHTLPVVRLNAPARDRAKSFVIRNIHPVRKG